MDNCKKVIKIIFFQKIKLPYQKHHKPRLKTRYCGVTPHTPLVQNTRCKKGLKRHFRRLWGHFLRFSDVTEKNRCQIRIQRPKISIKTLVLFMYTILCWPVLVRDTPYKNVISLWQFYKILEANFFFRQMLSFSLYLMSKKENHRYRIC